MDGTFADHYLFDHITLPSTFIIHIVARSLMIGISPAGSFRTCWIFSFYRPCSFATVHDGTEISNPKAVYEIY